MIIYQDYRFKEDFTRYKNIYPKNHNFWLNHGGRKMSKAKVP
jgi:hypothetical protein